MRRSQDDAQPALPGAVTTRCVHCHRRLVAGARCPAHPELMASGPAHADALPRAIAGMPVLGLLGRGGCAAVYLARRGDELVAIKVAHQPADARLAREAAILCALGPPTTPRFLDEGRMRDGRPFAVMEYVGQDSLSMRLAERDHACVEPAGAGRMLLALCEAIERMHAIGGVVHRDLKPENIVFRPDGRVALIDFGLARRLHEPGGAQKLTRAGERLGTHHYMAPEQWLGDGAVDARTDVYALGAVLFEMLTGRPPFVGNLAAVRRGHTTGRCPRPSELAAVPAALDDVVLGCLAKKPDDRYQRALDVAAAFQLALAGAGSEQRGEPQAHEPLRAQAEVVLVALRTAAPAPQVAALLEPEDAVLACVERDGESSLHVVALPWAPSIRAGLASARRLAALARVELAPDGPIVLHVAELAVRHRRGRVRLAGAALQRPGAWFAPGPAAPATPAAAGGFWATPAAAWYLEAGAAEQADPAGLLYLDAEPPEVELYEIDPRSVPLRGRDELFAAALDDIRGALTSARPVLWTLEGAEGLGKTQAQQALARLLRSEHEADVFYVRARATRGPHGVLRSLCRLALGLPEGLVTAPALAAAWGELGCAPSPAGVAALAVLLAAPGHAPGQAPPGSPVQAAPGALRQAAAAALAQALVHRARRRPLVILLDDAHWADPATLDALERATMAGVSAPLAVCASTRPALFTLRPRWGDRAAASRRMTLAPLDAAATRALLGDLLRPVEFVPAPVVERLHGLSGGIPLHVVELARMVRTSGAIRRHRGLDGYYIAADELLAGGDAPMAARLARRALAGVPAPLVPLAELCALVGAAEALSEADARGIQAALRVQVRSSAPAARPAAKIARPAAVGATSDDVTDTAPGTDPDAAPGTAPDAAPAMGPDSGPDTAPDTAIDALCELDVSVGLARLERHGVLLAGAQGYRLRHPMLARALVSAIPAPRRWRLHAAVLAHGQRAAMAGERLAYHAAQAGDGTLAAVLHLEQAEDARARHDYVAAENQYTLALAHASPASAAGEAAISGRGRVRYRLQRFGDALADLRRARALAEAREDEHACVSLLLEESTVLDWCHAYAEAEPVAAEAAERAGLLGEPRLLAAADLALGRLCYRREDLASAIPLLEHAATRAALLCEDETRVIALLLLAPALAYADRRDQAAACFEEAMALCTATGDEFHLAVAHINRQVLWMKEYEIDRAVADLEACMELSRRLGNAQLERPATFNLAELLYWRGDMDAALRLARRSHDMQQRFVREPVYDEALLLARILWRSDPDAARAHMDWMAAHCRRDNWPPHARVLHAMMEQVLAALACSRIDRATWETLVAQAQAHAPLDEHREILVTVVELACRCGQPGEARHWMQRARAVARDARLWIGRLDEIARQWTVTDCDAADHANDAPAGDGTEHASRA
jgi:eukaryotic-like serine/threonine-protein kinase